MSVYLDRAGRVIDQETALRLREDDGYRVVAWDVVGDVAVETRWNCGPFSGMWPPFLFETFIRRLVDGPGPRYPEPAWVTEADAVAGHARILEQLRAGGPVTERGTHTMAPMGVVSEGGGLTIYRAVYPCWGLALRKLLDPEGQQ